MWLLLNIFEERKNIMADWQPISLDKLYHVIFSTEKELIGELNNFWELVKIEPVKWSEKEYGEEGGGFWVVAICGRRVIWYNDIEEGFNISEYKFFGQIDGYFCDQDQLSSALTQLFALIKFGGSSLHRAGPPQNLI